jgi:hypothetical protein
MRLTVETVLIILVLPAATRLQILPSSYYRRLCGIGVIFEARTPISGNAENGLQNNARYNALEFCAFCVQYVCQIILSFA